MRRHWISFDYAVTNAEFADIPSQDVVALFRAMKKYARGEASGWIVKNYGDSLMMIKASNQGEGRCLFFAVRKVDEEHEELVAVLAYKKETQEAPQRIIDTARERMDRFRGKRDWTI